MMVLMPEDMEIIYDFYYFSYKTTLILVRVGTKPLFFGNIKYS